MWGQEACLENIDQFSNGDCRSDDFVGADISTCPEHEEGISRCQERFQQQVSVFVSGIPVAHPRMGCGGVEAEAGRGSGKVSVVHSEEAHDTRGDAPLGKE
jgi:hypothetical protein